MPFVKGQSGNPGGKPGKARQALDELLDEVFTQQRRRNVLRKLVTDAEDGNHDARTLLLAYTFGRPTEYREIGGVDGGQIQIRFFNYADAVAEIASPEPESDE